MPYDPVLVEILGISADNTKEAMTTRILNLFKKPILLHSYQGHHILRQDAISDYWQWLTSRSVFIVWPGTLFKSRGGSNDFENLQAGYFETITYY